MTRFANAFVLCSLFAFTLVSAVATADAKTKRLDKDLISTAEELAKDREAAFRGEEAMPMAEFQVKWTALAEQVDALYKGHTVKIKKFGNSANARKVFTHLIYVALKVDQQAQLTPKPSELISRHTFLQELTLEGACYTGGDPFPRKMKDILKAQAELQMGLRTHLNTWNNKYRKKFEKEFGQSE